MVGEMSQTSIIITDGTTLILANGFPIFLGDNASSHLNLKFVDGGRHQAL